jgi:hypothetical protein
VAPPHCDERPAPVADHPRLQPALQSVVAPTPVFGSVPRSPAFEAPTQRAPRSASFAPAGLRHAVIESITSDRTERNFGLPPAPMPPAIDFVSSRIGDAHAPAPGRPPNRREELPPVSRPRAASPPPVRAADAMQPRSAVCSRSPLETHGTMAPRTGAAPSQDIVIHTVEVRVAAPSPEAPVPQRDPRPDPPRPGAWDESSRHFLRKV